MITIECPSCGTLAVVSDTAAGCTGKCRVCLTPVHVPTGSNSGSTSAPVRSAADSKTFYTLDEAKLVLGKSEEEIADYAREGRLHNFRDGSRAMFKVDQVKELKLYLLSDEARASSSSSMGGETLDEDYIIPFGESLDLAAVEAPAAPAYDDVLICDGCGGRYKHPHIRKVGSQTICWECSALATSRATVTSAHGAQQSASIAIPTAKSDVVGLLLFVVVMSSLLLLWLGTGVIKACWTSPIEAKILFAYFGTIFLVKRLAPGRLESSAAAAFFVFFTCAVTWVFYISFAVIGGDFPLPVLRVLGIVLLLGSFWSLLFLPLNWKRLSTCKEPYGMLGKFGAYGLIVLMVLDILTTIWYANSHPIFLVRLNW